MINIAIIGFGIVGSGVYEVLQKNNTTISKRAGDTISIKRIVDIRNFEAHPAHPLFTQNIDDVLCDDDISVVVEAMGGVEPAYYYVKSSLLAKKSVVTSNKELVATHGTELIHIAKQNGVCFLFEASVGGGTPIITPLHQSLSANNISAVYGIVNGTTNFILGKMENDGLSFEEALSSAQKKGFAEANPSADIDGIDAVRKISILASLCFGFYLPPQDIYCCGIRHITQKDIISASKNGCALKLLAYAKQSDDKIYCGVEPCLIQKEHILSAVDGVNNGVIARCDMLGEALFYGPGAGGIATASAIIADIIDSVKIGSRLHETLCWGAALPKDIIKPVQKSGVTLTLSEITHNVLC